MRRFILFSLLLFTLSSCLNGGYFASANVTNVELSEANYQIVARSITGTAVSSYLFGFSGAFRGEMQSFGIFKLDGPDFLYQTAMDNLWTNFESRNSDVVGRRLALVNVRYDSNAVNVLGLYSEARVAITADVIEFTED
jgi:hypothetical protein